jgi:hypothetical protein
MAENFGLEEDDTDDTFPMSVPYIAEMQENDKKLMAEIKKDYHKYKFKKIEDTHILARDDNIYVPTSVCRSTEYYIGLYRLIRR